MSTVRLFETTLRDGTYEVNFQLDELDTAFLAAALDRAGFSYIEVCHGIGFGVESWKAKAPGMRPATTDELRIRAASAVVKRAKLACIIVAGASFTPPEELERLWSYGVRVVRIALEPQDALDPYCLAYVDRARALGFETYVNLMQTYAVPLARVAKSAEEVARRGGSGYFIVDSAGGMSATEIAGYVRATHEASGLAIGLHAHNNGDLATANCLAAIDAGATLVDSTLQGIGRATGNPRTEQLLLALQRRGHETGIDRELVLRLGTLARPLFAERGMDPLDFVSGAARLHSRFVGPITAEARRRQLAPAALVWAVGERLSARGTVVTDAALVGELLAEVELPPSELALDPATDAVFARGIEARSRADGPRACVELFSRGQKHHKPTVLCIVPATRYAFDAPTPFETRGLTGVVVPWRAEDDWHALPIDRRPDVVVFDPACVAVTGAPALAAARCLPAAFDPIVATAIVDLALRVGGGVTVAGDDAVAGMVRSRLVEASAPDGAAVLCVATLAGQPVPPSGSTVITWGALRDDEARNAVESARAAGVRVLRPHLSSALASRAEALAALDARVAALSTKATPFVDELVAPCGEELVVDDASSPRTVLSAPGTDHVSRHALELAHRTVGALLRGDGVL